MKTLPLVEFLKAQLDGLKDARSREDDRVAAKNLDSRIAHVDNLLRQASTNK